MYSLCKYIYPVFTYARILFLQAVAAVGDIDLKRRKNFKKHEMDEARKYKSKFRDLTEEEQQKKLEEHLEKSKKHERLHHPVRDNAVYTIVFVGINNTDNGECW